MGNCVRKAGMRVLEKEDDDDERKPIVRRKPSARVLDDADHDENKPTVRIEGSVGHVHHRLHLLPTGKPQTSLAAAEPFVTSTRGSNVTKNMAGDAILSPLVCDGIKVFALRELKQATENFSKGRLIGEGGFGRVYYGWVQETGTVGPTRGVMPVAIKKMVEGGVQGRKEWLSEVNYLGQLRHSHLVKLIGYCIEENQHLLIYEYMTNGSLDHHLFGRRGIPLLWDTRIKIAFGVAKAMEFLHKQAPPVIYRDLKAANILLDSNFNAKISDFGLAKDGPTGNHSHVTTRVLGTYGYAAPEYVKTGHLRVTSDVYGFGVLLLEIITGLPALDLTRTSSERELVTWVRPYLVTRDRQLDIMDPMLNGQYSRSAASLVILLATKCLLDDANTRPDMTTIMETLGKLVDLLELEGKHYRYGRGMCYVGSTSTRNFSG